MLQHSCSIFSSCGPRFLGKNGNYVAFSMGSGQIGDASKGQGNHLRPVVGAARPARLRSCGCRVRRQVRRLRRLAGKIPQPREGRACLLRDAARQPIDDALALWFPGRRVRPARTSPSFMSMGTGGARGVVCGALGDRRRAGRGARRIYPPGFREWQARPDRSRGPRRSRSRRHRPAAPPGVAAAEGSARRSPRDWRAQIIEASALFEAGIDFADEGDVPCRVAGAGARAGSGAAVEIEQVLAAQGAANVCARALWLRSRGPRMSANRR